MTKNNANPPQKGIVTHHHDQSIYPINFNVTNDTPSSPVVMFKELFEFDLLIVLNFNWLILSTH